jgi:hypothetical protein
MTLHQLRIFLAVAQATTLTRASKQLGLAQPSLSKQLATLEESIGTLLFERAHKRMVLTDAGRLLLHHADGAILAVRTRHSRDVPAALSGELCQHVGPPLHASRGPLGLEGSALVVCPRSVLTQFEELDALSWIIRAVVVVYRVAQQEPHYLDEHIGHTRRFAACVAPLLDVLAFQLGDRFVAVPFDEWFNDKSIDLLCARPPRTKFERCKVVLG